MYNVFAKEDNTDTMDTTMTNNVALTMESTITGVQTATIPELVAITINQLSNQPDCADEPDGGIVVHQRTPPPSNPTILTSDPTTQHFSAATIVAATTGGFNPGNGGGGRGERSRQGCGGCGGGRNQCTPITNYGRTQGVGSVGQGRGCGRLVPQAPGAFTLQAPSFVTLNAQNIVMPFSNTVNS
jgi:hypothetical protein